MPSIEFGCRPTIIGSMPHIDPAKSCGLVLQYLRDFPAWPQLPARSFRENMYVQFSEGFPGVVVEGLNDEERTGKERIFVDGTRDSTRELENLYAAIIENRPQDYRITEAYAAGLYHFLTMTVPNSVAVKGQVTGPVSWGLTITDQDRKPVIYDDTLADAVAKLLRMKVEWQEQQLKDLNKNTIVFVDEPYLSSIGSAFVALSSEKVISLIEDVLNVISGIKGIHCCGNTDWAMVLKTNIDILSFDAFDYADTLSLYTDEVNKFINRSGTIAWGIVPTQPDSLAKESVASLKDRLGEAMVPFTRKGLSFRQLAKQSLLTPSCGLATLKNEDAAERALEMLTGVSELMRHRYV